MFVAKHLSFIPRTWLLGSAVAFLLLTLFSLAQEKGTPSLPTAKPQTSAAPAELLPLQDAVEKIRQQRGSLYAGTSLEAASGADQTEFQQVLLAEAERQPAPELGAYRAPPPLAVGPSTIHLTQSPADQLRLIARSLELAAADFEDAGKFQQADRWRVLVARLRREARELAKPADQPPAESASTLR